MGFKERDEGQGSPEVAPDTALVAVRNCGVVPGRSSLSLPVFRTEKGNFMCAAGKL